MRLLVVEDEKILREALVNGLKIKEYAVDAALFAKRQKNVSRISRITK